MRFRGRITDLLLVRQFAQLLQTLSKCSSQFVLRITADKFIFVLSEKDVRSNGATAWCEVPKDAYFSDYKMEGIFPEDEMMNEIYMEINSEMMASRLGSLRSSSSVISIKIKLTNRVLPCLTFEIESETERSNSVCLHDIPVTIITRSHWKEYQQPDLPEFNISLAMPDLKVVRSSLDRIKSCGSRLTVSAKSDGSLSFSIEGYTVTSTVKLTNLRVFDVDEEDQENRLLNSRPRSSKQRKSVSINSSVVEREGIYRVEIDMKHFMQLIPAEDQKPDSFICSLVDSHMLHLFYIYGEITLQYCIPGVG